MVMMAIIIIIINVISIINVIIIINIIIIIINVVINCFCLFFVGRFAFGHLSAILCVCVCHEFLEK